MIKEKRLAVWLRELADRPAGMSDLDHIAQIRAATSDSAWILYLDAIRDRLDRGIPYGAAITDPMAFDLSESLQDRLHATPNSIAVDAILLDAAFHLLLSVSDHSQLMSMFDRAGFRYSQHREQTRGPGPYDIDLFTAMTDSHPDADLTGETANVSFSFTDAGELDGVRSYSMGQAPANPLQRGGEIPNYAAVRKRIGPRTAEPLWWLTLTTPARDRSMAAPPKLAEFVQGWALQADEIKPDFERRLEVRGRARPFRGVQLVEIGYGGGVNDALPISKLTVQDFTCMRQLFANRQVIWCLHPLVADVREDVFPYNCFISFGYPTTPEGLERAEATYLRERSKID